MGAANRSTGRLALTTRLTVNLRAAAPIDTSLTFRAWIDQVDGQQITIPAACPGTRPPSHPLAHAASAVIAAKAPSMSRRLKARKPV